MILLNFSPYHSEKRGTHFNLEKFQIIPFFIADHEGNITKFLNHGLPIKFDNEDYNVPRQWRYLWGVDNDNEPFIGNNFEFANFTDLEIKVAIDEVLDSSINIEKIREIRLSGSGINKLDERIDAPGNKIKITTILINNLFKNYQDRKDSSVFDRPIFIAIRRQRNPSKSHSLCTAPLRALQILSEEVSSRAQPREPSGAFILE
jgi:hypothetical protein